MHMQSSRVLLFLFGIAGLALSGWVAAEPPSRAARLSAIRGTVSFSPAGQSEWVRAVMNRPLTTGDRLWVDADSRAELQLGGTAIRLGGGTDVTLLNLDDNIVQVQISEGALKVRVRRMGPNQAFEVDTPNLAFFLDRPGEFRINVDPNDDATAVMVQSGRGDVYGEAASYEVDSRQGYRFYGTGLDDYDRLKVRRDDDLDRWAHERDLRRDNSRSARYVSPEVVGYEDLDANGTWRTDPNYGSVWTPTHVAAGWTPYRDGHWAWIDPWGWTWVDDAPWGYAVSHYGRWANIGSSWGWVPGPPREQAVYAPALVAFVGGQNSREALVAGGAIAALVGWFPLAPREVYQPSYPVSRGYFDNINRSNAVIAPTTLTNVYNTTIVSNTTTIVNNAPDVTKVLYANQQVAGAVVAVPAQAFVQSQPVAKAAVPVSKQMAITARVVHVAAVAPMQQSVQGGAPAGAAKPPARERAVVAHTAPPPRPVAFAVEQQQLAAKPGTPIDDAHRNQLKPAVAPAKVSVVPAARAPAPSTPPPATPPAPKSPEARKAEAAKSESAKPDAAKTGAAKPGAAKMEAVKADAAKAEAAKATAAKADAVRNDAAKADAARVEAAKSEAAKAAAAKADAERNDAAKAGVARADAAKAEAVKATAAKADAARNDAAKADAARAEAAKAEAAKATAAKAGAARNDAAKADAARAEAAKGEAAKAAAAKAGAARNDAAKADAVRAQAAKAEAAKATAARADAARNDAARANVARAEAAKGEAAKAAAAKADAAKANAAKAEAAKAASANASAARADAARAEVARAEAAKAAAVKAEAARAEAAKSDAAKAAKAKADADAKKAEDEKKGAEDTRKH